MLRESLSDTTLESRLTYIRLNHTAAYTRTRYLYVVRVTKVLDNDIPVLHGTSLGRPSSQQQNTQFTPTSIKPAVNRRPTTRRPHAHPTHLTTPHFTPPTRESPAGTLQALRTRKA